MSGRTAMPGWTVPPGYRVHLPQVNIAREILDRHVEDGRGDATALVAADRRWTYGELAREVGELTAGLAAHGVRRGDSVLFRCRNTAAFCALVIATWRIGAVPVLTNSQLQRDELAYILDNSDARIAVAASDAAAPLRSLLAEGKLDRLVLLDGPAAGPAEVACDELRRPDAAPPCADTAALDPAFMLYSSGTTGRPKGIVHAHRWIVTVGDLARLQMDYQADDVVLTPGEYSFMGTFAHCFIFPLYSGATAGLFDEKPSPESVFRAIRDRGATKFFSVPTFYRTVLAQGAKELAIPDGQVRFMLSTGEPLGASVYENWKHRFGVEIFEVYGVSEVELLVGNSTAHPVRPGSIGKAMPGLAVDLLDDELRPVPMGEPGRLMIHRSDPGLFIGYRKQPEVWRRAHKGEWYDTGDIMRRDAEGYLWYLGRNDDLFKTRGHLVSPQEIENALLAHPAVAEAAVVGLPDERVGYRIGAFVVVKPGHVADAATADEIRVSLAGRLATYKRPEVIEFRDALPKSAVGKILRRALRDGT